MYRWAMLSGSITAPLRREDEVVSDAGFAGHHGRE
jgi:hypothetical protein